jgi:two-component system cell cycle response regulator
VIEANSVPEARERLRTARAEIVLLDVQLPGGGGDAVLGTIREDPALAHLPVVAVTAFAMGGDRARLLAAGYDGYISKPIDTKTFGAEIEDFIARGRSRGA